MRLPSLFLGLLACLIALLALPASAQMYRPKPKPRPTATAPGDTTRPAPGQKASASTYKVSTDPAVFQEDVVKLLGSGKTQLGAETAQQFQATWSAGRFTAPQQQRIIALTQQMVTRRFKAHPHYEQFFGVLISAAAEPAMSGSALDDLLTVFDKTLANDPPAAMPRLLASVNQILREHALYKGRTNSLQFSGGRFAFQYYDADNPAPAFGTLLEPPKPEVKPEEPKKEEPKPAPVKKAAPKKKTVAKKPAPKPKPANDGWGDWGAPEPAAASGKSSDDGWGSWDAPAPRKAAPKKAAPKPAPADDGWGSPAPAKTAAKPAAKPADDGWGSPTPAPAADAGFGWGEEAFDKPNANADKQSGLIPFVPEPMPQIIGPALVLKDVDLALTTSRDSAGAVIRKTTGALMLSKGQFVGAGGTVEWEPVAGQPATATLKQFTFDVTKPGFKAEGATIDYG
ncbi:MAG TPA: hypothetical protein VEI97_13980, partial [bacterium]|nr:hypothetical protein [bacterium]